MLFSNYKSSIMIDLLRIEELQLQHNMQNLRKHKSGILLFGASFATGNRGVSALAAASIDLIKKYFENDRIYLVFPGPDEKKENQIKNNRNIIPIKYRFTPFCIPNKNACNILCAALLYKVIKIEKIRRIICRLFPLIKIASESRFIGDIWGGDSFSDIYGLTRMVKRSFGSMLSLLLGVDLVLLPQSYGPYKTIMSRILAKAIVSGANRIYSRAKESEWLNRLGIPNNISQSFCPDVAFTLKKEPIESDGFRWQVKEINKRKTIIGVNISGLLYAGGYTGKNMFNLGFDYKDFINELCRKLIKEEYRIVLIPHTYKSGTANSVEDDLYASRDVLLSIGREQQSLINLIEDDLNQYELKYLIGKTDFFIGSRMHSCIAAISQAIPAVGISYSHKFMDVYRAVGLEELMLDAKKNSIDESIEFVLNSIKKRQEIKRRIENNLEDTFSRIHECFSELAREYNKK